MMTMVTKTKVNPVSDYSPYKSIGSLGINIRAITKYAREQGKKLSELTPKEVEKFKTL